ncbi:MULTISPECIES: hypothetical protein [Enterobacterales]|uniref:hypothetical protein n=1 Tax=Enterobacterales TaxID=91347 RepID=UPI002ED7AC29
MKMFISLAQALLPLYRNVVFRFFLGGGIFSVVGLLISNGYISNGYLCIVMIVCGMYSCVYFSFFALIDIGMERMIGFHEKHNGDNLGRQPVRGVVNNRVLITKFIKGAINIMCFYFLFRMVIIPMLINNGFFR